MQAIPGGQAKNDTIDAQKIAVLRRGGMLPQVYVYSAKMRATRAVLRRRMPRMRQRAAWLAHLHNTNRPYNLPESGKTRADKANQAGVATRCPAPAVQTSIAVDLTLLDSDARWLTALERERVRTAKAHDAQIFSRLRASPGIGTRLDLMRLDEIHDIRRFPRGQAFVSAGRLVKCATESAGTRDGTAGTKSGSAYRTWAFSDAAVLFLRNHPAGQQDHAR